ncbi:uncharacterized protein MAM_02234 [Metarhizium album ARSEF 1941]|uniref:Uncharacterized protein n=1 Tax=Metarhizium album (strain ARSEF 1941) TaxID=1081103 RepID=A0A0B2X4U7_METAS|nr:uncharacterized protein MAM_02234 [Metarhizium album ARSEF 1941]KHO00311.1 hypothetical protein MAM_02234 [Metarhizium album ARSEF 1941]
MAQTGQTWLIVHAGLTGFVVIPAIVVWLLTLGLARSQGDPARVAFSWLKACHPFFALSLMLTITSDVAGVVRLSWEYENGSFDQVAHTTSDIDRLDQTDRYANQIAIFFERIVNALLVIVLAELGSGFRRAQIKKPAPGRNVIRTAAFSGALVIFAVSVTCFALSLAALLEFTQSNSTSDLTAVADAWDKDRWLRAAGDMINFAISVGQVIYAGYVVGQYAGLPGRNSAIFYLVSTILDAIRWLVSIVLLGKWILPQEELPVAWDIIDPVLVLWLRLIILVLLLVIGNRRQAGLWSTIQPWMQDRRADHLRHSVLSHGQVPSTQPIHYQYPPQPQENPGWRFPQPNPTPAGAWDPYEMASPYQVAGPEELDSRQMQQSLYYTSPCHVPVEASAEKA